MAAYTTSERKAETARLRVAREIKTLVDELPLIIASNHNFEEKIDLLSQELVCTLTMLTVIKKNYSVDMNHYTDYKDKAEDDLESYYSIAQESDVTDELF